MYKTKLDCNWSCNEPIYGVSLDGVWFCIRKSLFDNSTYALKFDENTYQGFHLYDLDICMQINKLNYHIQIITDILIEHFSIGSFNEEWIKNSFIFSNKWKDQLPLSNGLNLQKEEINEIEYNKLISYIHDSVDTNKSLQLQLESIRQSKSYRFGKFLLKPIKWIKQ